MTKPSSITVEGPPRPKLSQDGRTLTVRIPISLRRQGGRKQVLTPASAAPWTAPVRVDRALVKAIVRAHRWRDMLESGRYDTVRELAKAEKINESYLGRVLRLTLLSPAIVERILSGKQHSGLDVARLTTPLPLNWDEQERALA
jgi:hypothetical protein